MSQGEYVRPAMREGANRRPIELAPSRLLVDALSGPLGAAAQVAGMGMDLPGDTEHPTTTQNATIPRWLLMALQGDRGKTAAEGLGNEATALQLPGPKDTAKETITKKVLDDLIFSKILKDKKPKGKPSTEMAGGAFISAERRSDDGRWRRPIISAAEDMQEDSKRWANYDKVDEKYATPFNSWDFARKENFLQELPKNHPQYRKPLFTSVDPPRGKTPGLYESGSSVEELIAGLLQGNSTPHTQASTADLIDALTDAERVHLRQEAIKAGAKDLPRNLYYNYTTQKWIKGSDFGGPPDGDPLATVVPRKGGKKD